MTVVSDERADPADEKTEPADESTSAADESDWTRSGNRERGRDREVSRFPPAKLAGNHPRFPPTISGHSATNF